MPFKATIVLNRKIIFQGQINVLRKCNEYLVQDCETQCNTKNLK